MDGGTDPNGGDPDPGGCSTDNLELVVRVARVLAPHEQRLTSSVQRLSWARIEVPSKRARREPMAVLGAARQRTLQDQRDGGRHHAEEGFISGG